MDEQFFIRDSKKIVSSQEASVLYGVTNDHVARLCRQGKLKGKLDGHMWFVERSSLEAFFGNTAKALPAAAPVAFLSSREAAKAYRVSHDYIARLCRQGKVAGQLRNSVWYADAASLQEFFGKAPVIASAADIATPVAMSAAPAPMQAKAASIPVLVPVSTATPILSTRARAVLAGAALFIFAGVVSAGFFAPIGFSPAPKPVVQTAAPAATTSDKLARLYAALVASSTLSGAATTTIVQNTYPVIERTVERTTTQDLSTFVTYDFLNSQIERLQDSIADHGSGGGGGITDFSSLVASDIPDLSGTYLPIVGGTLTGALILPYASTTATSTLAGLALTLDCSVYNNGGALTTDSSGNVICDNDDSTAGSGSPGGNNTYVQYNDSGSFGGDAGFTYNKTTDLLTVAFASTTGFSTSYASSTNFVAGVATTTSLAITSVTSSLLKTNSLGQVVAAVAGTDYLTTATTFAYPFPSNATTTSIAFNGGLSGALTGNASTATALQTGRTINGVTFDGTANITLSAASSTLLANDNTFSGTNIFSNTITGSITGNAGTVTNGVYTTTFNSLFDTRFVVALAATTSVSSITTLPNLSLPYSQLSGTPTIAAYPFPSNATTTQISFNGGSISSSATTTGSQYISSLAVAAGAFLAVDPSGKVISTTTPSGGSSFSYPFPSNATTTLLAFSGGLTSASTTLTGPFVFANATGTNATTTNLYVSGAASTTQLYALNGTINYASTTALTVSGTLWGAGLSACNTSSDKLLWNDGIFSCGTDQSSGGGGSDSNWNFFNGSGVRLATTTNQVLIGGSSTSTLLSPLAKLGVIGGASIDYASTTALTASYASTTNFIASSATTTSLAVTGVVSSLLKTNALGQLVAAVAGTDYQTFSYPFPSNATTTLLAFNGGATFVGATTTALAVTGSSTVASVLNVGGAINAASTLSISGTISSTVTAQFFGRTGGGTGNSFMRVQNATGDMLLGVENSAGSSILSGTTAYATVLAANNASGVLQLGAGGLIATLRDGNLGVGTTSPYAKLSVAGQAVAEYFTATSTTASVFPYASTTAITATTASTTNLIVSGISNSLLKTVNGVVTAAVAGTDYLTTATTFAYPFPSNATTTLLAFSGGLTSYASTTIGGGTAITGLTISGGATTTGNAYFASSVGIGSTSPSATLSVNGPTNGTKALAVYGGNGVSGASGGGIYMQGGVGATGSLIPGGDIELYGGAGGNGSFPLGGAGGSLYLAPGVAGANGFTSGNVVLGINKSGTAVGNVGIGTILPNNTLQVNGYAAIGFGSQVAIAPTNGLIVLGTSGIGTSSPFAKFAVHANNGETNKTLFAIGSSTASATTTLFSISNTGSTTAANGVNITAGCYAVNGSCLASAAFSYLFPSNATTTLLAFDGGLTSASTTLTGPFAFANATGTNATTTSLGIAGIASSLLKTTSSGSVVAAAGGTDYEVPLTFSTGLLRSGNSVVNTIGYPFPSNATTTLLAFDGGLTSASTTLTGSTTLANATSSNFFSGRLGGTTFAVGATASTTIDAAGNLAVAGTLTGAGLTSCSGTADKLLWNAGLFSCGVDDTGSGAGTDANWTFFNGSAIRVSTTTNQVLIGASSTSTLAKLEVVGGLFADYATSSLSLFGGRVTGNSAAFGATASTTITSAGFVGIGSSTPSQKLTVAGGTILQTASGNPTLAGSISSSNHTYQTIVSGNYAYSVDQGGGLRIVDVTDPKNPSLISSYAYNAAPAAVSLALSGRYAFVGDTTAGLVILDVSNAASPKVVSTTAILDAPWSMAASGKYLYVADSDDQELKVVDISNPAAPTIAGTFAPGGSAQPYSVAVSGKYAYVGDLGDSKIYIVDISNPAAPALSATYSDSGISPIGLYAAGRYLYVADAAEGFYSLDVSSATSTPTLVGSYAGSYFGVAVGGGYAYLADNGGNLVVLSLNLPASPALVGSYATGGNPLNISLAGKYAYVSDDGGGIKIVDINGASLPTASIGALASNMLSVSEDLRVGNNLYADGSLNIGISGIFSRGTIAAYIASSTQSSAAVATFMGGNVGIGSTTPIYKLQVESNDPAVSAFIASINDDDVVSLFYTGRSGGAFSGKTVFQNNSNNAIVFNTTGLVGVASTTPWARFSVDSSSLGANVPSFAVGSSTRTDLIVTQAGYVGIGTTTPEGKLHLSGPVGTRLLLDNGVQIVQKDTYGTVSNLLTHYSDEVTYLDNPGGPLMLRSASTTGSIRFAVGATTLGAVVEAMRITSAGTVGIGTTTPWARLAVDTSNLGTATSSFVVGSSTRTDLLVTQAGYVGIGTTAPLSALHVAGTTGITWHPSANALVTIGTGGTVGGSLWVNTPSLNSSFSSGLGVTGSYGTPAQRSVVNINAYGVASAGGYGSDLAFSTTNGTTLSERMRIDMNGNVGVGTTTPFGKFSIHAFSGQTNTALFTIGSSTASATTTLFSVSNTGSTTIANGVNITAGCYAVSGTCLATGGSLSGTTGQVAYFSGTNTAVGTSTINISTAGLVGIGTTNPQQTLDIYTAPSDTAGTGSLAFSYTPGDDLWGMRLDSTGSYDFNIDRKTGGVWSTALTIDRATGKVGIGTTSPSQNLHIFGGASSAIAQLDANAGQATIQVRFGTNNSDYAHLNYSDSTGTFDLNNTRAFPITFSTNNTERIRIDSSGNVGIGTSSPVGRFAVVSADNTLTTNVGEFRALNLSQGVGISYTGIRKLTTNGTNDLYIDGASGTTGNIILNASSGGSTGNVGIGDATPAAKLTFSNNVGTGFLDNYSEYQMMMYDSGVAGSSYGLGIKSNTMVFNSGAGAYSFDRGGSATTMVLDTAGLVGIGTTTPWGRLSVDTSSLAAGAPSFVVGSSTRTNLIVTQAGYTGIGTTSPRRPLHIEDNDSTITFFDIGSPLSSTRPAWFAGAVAANFEIGTTTNFTTFTPVFSIEPLAGTASFGNSAGTGDALMQYAGDSNAWSVGYRSSDKAFVIASSTNFAGTAALAIAKNGNTTIVGSGTTCVIGSGTGATSCTSDERLKANITDISGQDALDKLSYIQGVTYNWADKGRDQNLQVGVLAQDVLKAFPQLVGSTTVTYNGVLGNYYTVSYEGLIGPLVSGVNELNLRTQGFGTTTPEDLADGPFDNSSDAFKQALSSALEAVENIAQAGVRTLGRAVYATVGVFDQVLTQRLVARVVYADEGTIKKFNTDELCVGSVCVSEAELEQLLNDMSGEEPPAEEPPAEEPPAEEPPAEDPPAEEAPAEAPPTDTTADTQVSDEAQPADTAANIQDAQESSTPTEAL